MARTKTAPGAPATDAPLFETLTERFWVDTYGQDINLASTHRMRIGDTPYTLRVKIRRNAYDFQSWATVEVWSDPNRGWTTVETINGKAGLAVCTKVRNANGHEYEALYYGRCALTAEDKAYFETDRQLLLGVARQILGGGS